MSAVGKKPAYANQRINPVSGKAKGTSHNGQRTRSNDQIDGAYTNVPLVYHLTNLIGNTVELQVKNGTTYQGLFKTFSPNLELVLETVHCVDITNPDRTPSREQTLDELIVNFDDMCHVHAKNVDMKYGESGDTFTDSAISVRSQNNGVDDKMKDLVEWDADGPDVRCDDLRRLDDDNSSRFTPEEMFRRNATEFGVKSSYNDNMEIYTTKLVKEDTEDYRQKLAKADRIAREIEENSLSRMNQLIENGENDEENTFSAVIRPHKSPSHAAREPKDNNSQSKYPHSALRGSKMGDNSMNGKRGPPHGNVDQRHRGGKPSHTTDKQDLMKFQKNFNLVDGDRKQVKEEEVVSSKAHAQKSPPPKDLNKSLKQPTDGASIQPSAGQDAATTGPTTTGQPPRQQDALSVAKIEPPKQVPTAQPPPANNEATCSSTTVQEEITSNNTQTSSAPTTPTESAPKTSTKLNPKAKEFTLNPKAKEFKPSPSAVSSAPVPKKTATVSVQDPGNTRPDFQNNVVGPPLVNNPQVQQVIFQPPPQHQHPNHVIHPTSMAHQRPQLQRQPSYTAEGGQTLSQQIYYSYHGGMSAAGPVMPQNMPSHTPPSTYSPMSQGQPAPHPITSIAAMNQQHNPVTTNYHQHQQGANNMLYTHAHPGQINNGQPPQQPIHNNQSPAPTISPAPQAQPVPVAGQMMPHPAYPNQFAGGYGFQMPNLQAQAPPGYVFMNQGQFPHGAQYAGPAMAQFYPHANQGPQYFHP